MDNDVALSLAAAPSWQTYLEAELNAPYMQTLKQFLHRQQAEVCIYIVVILIFGVISHAPGKVRNFSLWHRRVLTREAYFGRGKGQVKDCGES